MKENTKLKNPAAVALGRLGGLARSPAKARAARRNGRLGGRPRKPLLATGAVALGLLALLGCSRAPSREEFNTRTASFERRLVALETESAIQSNIITRLIMITTARPAAKAAGPVELTEDEKWGRMYGALRHEIPITVYNRIADQAARQWPDDYIAQCAEIERQVAAYKKMNR